MAASKTNAVRLLERAGVPHSTLEYQFDTEHQMAESVADLIGLPPGQVFKTLVTRGDRFGVAFAVIPGDGVLDLKALAQATGDKAIEVVPLKEVQNLTGYVRGGVTAIAARKDYPVVLDESALLYDQITVSSGRRGCQILIRPDDYAQFTRARIGPIARPKDQGSTP